MEPTTEYEVIIKQEMNEESYLDTMDGSQSSFTLNFVEQEKDNAKIHQSRQKVYKQRKKDKQPKAKEQQSVLWYKCQLCARVYETAAGCQSHLVVKHCVMNHEERLPLIVEETIQSRFPCPDCNSAFESQEVLITHLKEHHGKVYEPTIKCLKCNFASDTEEGMHGHFRREHRITNMEIMRKYMALDQESVLHCYVCAALFPCKANLIRHINRYHNLDNNPGARVASMSQESNTSTTCDVKPKIGDDDEARLDSEKSRLEEPTYPCPFNCLATFDSRLDLQTHVRLGKHNKPSPAPMTNVNCRKCGVKYTVQNPCKCDVAKTTLYSTTKKNGKFAFLCRTCKKAFFSTAPLFRHLREEHGDDHSVETESKMGAPVEESLGPLPIVQHKCQHCDSSFVTRRDLMRHWREKHGKMDGFYTHGDSATEKEAKPSKPTNSCATEKKTSKCPFCHILIDAEMRMQHVLFGTHHFRCDDCKQDFTNLSDKNEHELLRHGNSKTIVQTPTKGQSKDSGERRMCSKKIKEKDFQL